MDWGRPSIWKPRPSLLESARCETLAWLPTDSTEEEALKGPCDSSALERQTQNDGFNSADAHFHACVCDGQALILPLVAKVSVTRNLDIQGVDCNLRGDKVKLLMTAGFGGHVPTCAPS